MGDRHSLAQRLLALREVLLVQHRRELLAKLLLEGLRRVREALGLELGLALVLGRGLLVADVEVLLDRLAALERLLEAAEGVRAPACVDGVGASRPWIWADTLTVASRFWRWSERTSGVGDLSFEYGRERASGTLVLNSGDVRSTRRAYSCQASCLSLQVLVVPRAAI